MKKHRTKIIISIFTFTIGVFFVAVWLFKFQPDLNVYSIKFCNLIQESKRYDGKTVRIRALYKQGYEASFLGDSDCKNLITVKCSLDNQSCDKIFDSIPLKQEDSDEIQIDVTGRYLDSEYDDFDGYVHQIEILEIKDVKVLHNHQ